MKNRKKEGEQLPGVKGRNQWNRKEWYSLQQKGSLTLESAAALPLYFLAMVMLISMMDIFRIQTILVSALSQSAKELGMYAYSIDGESKSPVGAVTDAACTAYASAEIQKRIKGENLTGIVGKQAGITLLGSQYQNGIITLKANYLYRSPAAVFPVLPVKIKAAVSAQAWLGYEGDKYGSADEGPGEEMVYVTDYESVYHTSEDCTHIKLTVKYVGIQNALQGKNQYGNKYHPCEKCMKGHGNDRFVYITEKGNRYHSNSSCGGLSRHVRLMKKSEAENRSACSRCREK